MSAYRQEPQMRAATTRALRTASDATPGDAAEYEMRKLRLGWLDQRGFHQFVHGNAPRWTVEEGQALELRWPVRAADYPVRPGLARKQLGI